MQLDEASLRQHLSAADQALAEALAASNHEGAARARGRRAAVLTLLDRDDDARGALTEALAEAQQHGLAEQERELRFMLGALATIAAPQEPAARTSAFAHWRQALKLAQASGDDALALRLHVQLAQLEARNGRPRDALKHLNAAAPLCPADDAERRYQLHRQRAALLATQGQGAAAREASAQALAAAEAHSPVLGLRARIEHRLFDPEGDLLALAAEAEALGATDLHGQAHMLQAQEAFAAGRFEEAAASAQLARRDALEVPDPILYTVACILIAGCRERQGDRVGVLAILLTALQSIEKRFGAGSGQPIVAVLDGLTQRWGPDEMTRARQAYRAWIARNPPPG